ncbi:hypothetical protein F3Y22_tig00112114pilonHSYRG00205 [Hibiscus syriacus]|uniref:Uncharacterized protein n=1 Tax=Hibiscus syriacus TaxID=106335 RepID=A0A6A2YE08_HIBSY|nr:hypothetical protein F3Y22_tig00112114pilonHSYRG00205 [Hibiscus syriacus]
MLVLFTQTSSMPPHGPPKACPIENRAHRSSTHASYVSSVAGSPPIRYLRQSTSVSYGLLGDLLELGTKRTAVTCFALENPARVIIVVVEDGMLIILASSL